MTAPLDLRALACRIFGGLCVGGHGPTCDRIHAALVRVRDEARLPSLILTQQSCVQVYDAGWRDGTEAAAVLFPPRGELTGDCQEIRIRIQALVPPPEQP